MTDKTTEERDRPFNPWVIPTTDRGRTYIAACLAAYDDHEARHGKRQRARRAVDEQKHVALLTAILSDVTCHALSGVETGIIVSRCKQGLAKRAGRYNPAPLGNTFPDHLDILKERDLAFIGQSIGHRKAGLATTISADDGLLSLMAEHGVTADDFGVSPLKEIIILKSAKKRQPATAGGRPDSANVPMDDEDLACAIAAATVEPPPGSMIDYDDTDTTVRMREQMRAINDHLATAPVTFDPIAAGVNVESGPSQRHLRRIFNEERFDCGGRMFGGYWLGLSKQQRFAGLRIDGERVVELDFGQMAPRSVYAYAGIPVPMEDIYAVPGFEAHRAGIKKIFGAMLFCRQSLKRFPKDTKHLFPKKSTVKDVTKAIMDFHPSISYLFHAGLGHWTQFIESEIMVGVLLDLMHQGITALPIHDALLVQERHSGLAKETMLRAFRDALGWDGVVSLHV